MDRTKQERLDAILSSPSYRLAEEDTQLLRHADMRSVRIQLELQKVELYLNRHQIQSTIVVFGGTQVVERSEAERRLLKARQALAEMPEDPPRQRAVQRAERILAKADYYDAAREFCQLASQTYQDEGKSDYVVVTGGGPGIMEAANRGAFDVGAKSIGLNITLPEEQQPNAYVTPELCFLFHYFAIRKMHFLMRAKGLLVFPGGFGTLDELFDALTLRQTQRMQPIPIVLFGQDFWSRVIDFPFLCDEGVIADQDLELFHYAETAAEAWDLISRFHEQVSEDF